MDGAEWQGDDNYIGSSSWAAYEAYKAEGMSLLDYTNTTPMGRAAQNDSQLIWSYTVSPDNPGKAIVTLAPVSSSLLIRNADTSDNGAKDCTYTIPLNVKSTKDGNLKVSVKAIGTEIADSTHTFSIGEERIYRCK